MGCNDEPVDAFDSRAGCLAVDTDVNIDATSPTFQAPARYTAMKLGDDVARELTLIPLCQFVATINIQSTPPAPRRVRHCDGITDKDRSRYERDAHYLHTI